MFLLTPTYISTPKLTFPPPDWVDTQVYVDAFVFFLKQLKIVKNEETEYNSSTATHRKYTYILYIRCLD